MHSLGIALRDIIVAILFFGVIYLIGVILTVIAVWWMGE